MLPQTVIGYAKTIVFQFHTITHELAHALGLFHTHCRPDRHYYVNIYTNRILVRISSLPIATRFIQPKKDFFCLPQTYKKRHIFSATKRFYAQFFLQKTQQENFKAESSLVSTSYDLPYEYGSVMHYRKNE